jgi:polyisoprenoid-binding protein YceI
VSYLTALFALVASATVATAATYEVDPNHTSVGFEVRHLFTYVDGHFDKFDGTIRFDPDDPSKAMVKGSIAVTSIDTNVEKRDNHLRSKDFFWVEEHPTITFESTKVSDVDATKKTGKLHGDLTVRGVTKPVVLDVSFLGAGKDPWGNEKAGFQGTTTINRKDFGLTWNETLEAGGVLVGEEVKITIKAEGNLVEQES